jgi:excisionase family DNA binding protein
MNPAPPGRLLRPDQVQERLNISRSKAYSLIAEGHFTVCRVGGALRITEQSLDEYIQRQISLYALEIEETVQIV